MVACRNCWRNHYHKKYIVFLLWGKSDWIWIHVHVNKSALYLPILSSTYSKNETNDFSFFSNKLPEQTALADPYLAAYSLSQLQRQLEGVTKSRSLAPDIAYVKALRAVLWNYTRRIFHSQEIWMFSTAD